MAYLRLKKAEARFGKRFDVLWGARSRDLPVFLRLECNPYDPGLTAVKQNHYLETGQIPMMCLEWQDMQNDFNDNVDHMAYGTRKDPKW
jgi:hypothetical protein